MYVGHLMVLFMKVLHSRTPTLGGNQPREVAPERIYDPVIPFFCSYATWLVMVGAMSVVVLYQFVLFTSTTVQYRIWRKPSSSAVDRLFLDISLGAFVAHGDSCKLSDNPLLDSAASDFFFLFYARTQ